MFPFDPQWYSRYNQNAGKHVISSVFLRLVLWKDYVDVKKTKKTNNFFEVYYTHMS